MRKVKLFLALFIAALSFSAASVDARSLSGVKPDQSIEQKVYKELKKLPNYSVFDFIDFKVNGGTVTLTGKVYSLGTKSQAARFVKDVPGVTNVINNIQDLPPSSFDDRIRAQALRAFANGGLSGYFWEINPDVRLIVENGHVTLEGYVMNSGDFNAMNIYANGIPGVFSVQNNLKIGKPMYR